MSPFAICSPNRRESCTQLNSLKILGNVKARKVQTVQNFAGNSLVLLSVSFADKNAYSAGKTSGVLRGGTLGANRGYVLANSGRGGGENDVRKSGQ